MKMAERIEQRLRDGLRPVRLEIIDESHRHAGHAGAKPGGETHYRVEIVSAAFEGESRVARQRMVYALLEQELADGVHALALKTLAPSEAVED